MNRITLIQKIIDAANFKSYLEIGSERGYSFLPLKVRFKTAVDPNFRIPKKRKLRWIFKVPENINNKYFRGESDDFFRSKKKKSLKERLYDVVLIDGMHTFKASLNDVLNSLSYLNEKGIIIMHDCLPPYEAAATPYFPTQEMQKEILGWTGLWCGDVWKTIVYLRRKYPRILKVSVVNTDFGLGLIQTNNFVKKPIPKIDKYLFEEIDKMTYSDLIEEVEDLLNLKEIEHIKLVVSEFEDVRKNSSWLSRVAKSKLKV